MVIKPKIYCLYKTSLNASAHYKELLSFNSIREGRKCGLELRGFDEYLVPACGRWNTLLPNRNGLAYVMMGWIDASNSGSGGSGADTWK
jgi:hypothetical protein